MPAYYVERCIWTSGTSGLSDFTVAGAATGYMTPAQANAVDQVIYKYAAELRDGNNVITAWEVGTGPYTVSSTTQARTNVLFSSNANAKVNFASAPVVMLCALGANMILAEYTDTYLPTFAV